MEGARASSARLIKTKSLCSSSHPDEEYIGEWLSEHEDKAESVIEKWLVSHPQSAKSLYLKYGHFLGMDAITPLSSIAKSKSMRHYISAPTIHNQFKRRPASELQKLEKQQLFVELLKDVVSPDVDVNHLTHKILVNILLLTKADRSSLFLVEGSGEEQILVSRLFDIAQGTSVQDAIRGDSEAIKMPVGVGIAGTVAQSGEKINLKDAYEDPRFNKAVDNATGYKTKSILCMPIKTPEGQVIGVAQVINKIQGEGVFTQEDEEDFQMYLNFCAIGIVNAQLFDNSLALSRRLQILLHLAKGLFEDTTKLGVVIDKVMQQSMELIPCESCTVLLLDQDCKEDIVFSHTFQVDKPKPETLSEESITVRTVENGEILDLDIAKRVASRAKPVMMSSVARSNNPSPQHLPLSKDTKSILCIPIFNKEGQVLGIVKLTNKLNQACFNQSDMESLEVFATFCGLGLHNVMVYERIAVTSARKKVALDILSYHASSTVEEVKRLQQFPIPKVSAYKLSSFKFDDAPLDEDHTVLASVRMFIDSGLVEAFKINIKVLYRWVLTVKKNYRPVTYHNWRHAFNVAQVMFAMFQEGAMAGKLNKLEQLGLLIACFCHDLDHRGTNNAFQVKSGSTLAQLYSTSTMEHHHFDHCIMILNSEGNQILNGLSPSKYTAVLKMLESAILSTDLAVCLKRRDSFKELVGSNSFNWDREGNRDVLRGMLMTACDVAAITKPWKIQKRVAVMVANEFFEQGDRERQDLQVEPIAMMDRQKKDELPKMQVGFIDFVCMPLYKVLAELIPPLEPLHDGVKSNRSNWQLLTDDPKAIIPGSASPESSIEILSPSSSGLLSDDSHSNRDPTSTSTVAPITPISMPPVTPTSNSTPPTSVVLQNEERNKLTAPPSISNGPVEGWRNSTGSSEESGQQDSPGHQRQNKPSLRGTHAEVASTRKHLKKCTMS